MIHHIATQGGGNIINTASNCAIAATLGMPSYNAMRGVVSAMSHGLALYHVALTISVNCVCPVDVLSSMLISERNQKGMITTGMPETQEE